MGHQPESILNLCGKLRRSSGVKTGLILLALLAGLHCPHSAPAAPPVQAPQPATSPLQAPQLTSFATWSQRCLEHLRAAHQKAISTDPFVQDGTVEINPIQYGHGSKEQDHHLQIDGFFKTKNAPGHFSFKIEPRETRSEHVDIPSVWYPTSATNVPVSERRYFATEKSQRLIPLDDPKGAVLQSYFYHRRINNVIVQLSSTLQPAPLLALLKLMEPALDACLMEGKDLPPQPCARIASLPPHPVLPDPVLRAPPPLTIKVWRMPKRGRLHLLLGTWRHELVRNAQAKQNNVSTPQDPITITPIDWFANFRKWQRFASGFSPDPNQTIIVGGRLIHADGTERNVEINVTFEKDRLESVQIVRHLPTLADVSLVPDWNPSEYGYPSYLIINNSGKTLHGTGLFNKFEGTVEIWQDGKWQHFAAKPPARNQKGCGRCYRGEPGDPLESGDWVFAGPSQQGSYEFKPGRYRFSLEYKTAPHVTDDRIVDVFEINSEFEIKSPSKS